MHHCSAAQVQQQLHAQKCIPRVSVPSLKLRQARRWHCTCTAMAGANPSPDAGAAYKERVRDMWRRRGPGYDVNNTLQPPLCQKLVQLANITAGATVLDVCTGTGTVALEAAEKAGSGGRVLGIDISEAHAGPGAQPHPDT